MKILPVLTMFLASAPALSVPGGQLETLPLGRFVCELPGDVETETGILQPADSFTVINASSYRTPAGEGAYLRLGDVVTMTSGPLRDARYHRISDKFIRKMAAEGTDTKVRCILRMANNDRSNGTSKN